ncbi:hypothetical protein [Bacillus suaedae]|uniref:Uncharacterized protein n=1 Tax=Halalkalibacter suaedae TaxID=2822140 RepID=A0A940WVR0_9BACI|nr:hypothetical protein [Bacillus suaedae]MBP3951467.1 hypothetical protein [Bacillus suaedae]
MKKTLNYYMLPIAFFILLSSVEFVNKDGHTIMMSLLGATLLGLVVGLIFHLAMVIKKKVSS